jgi:CheY-like chemotaxis protein
MLTSSHSPLLLVVEDHADTRELFTTYLRGIGYRVIEASLGTEALRLASETRPSLIVLDTALGGLLSGYDVCRALRAEPQLADTPILVVSAYSGQEDQQLALEAGCNGFLAKPCTPESLGKAVEALIGGHAPTPGRGVHNGEIA